MDKILHDPKDPKLWELWYIPYNGQCRILPINRMTEIKARYLETWGFLYGVSVEFRNELLGKTTGGADDIILWPRTPNPWVVVCVFLFWLFECALISVDRAERVRPQTRSSGRRSPYYTPAYSQRVQSSYVVECRVSILGITLMIWGSINI